MTRPPTPPGPTAAVPAGSAPGDDRRRTALRKMQSDATAFGRPWLADAFARLTQLTELGDCLAATSPEAAADVAGFCDEAYVLLTDVTADDEQERNAEWTLRESERRWGEYLSLMGGDVEPDPAPGVDPSDGWVESWEDSFATASAAGSPGPAEEDSPPAIDPGTLFRMLTGSPMSGPAPAPTPPPVTKPAAPTLPRAKPAAPTPPPPVAARPVPAPPPPPQPAPATPPPRPAPAPPPAASRRTALEVPSPPLAVSIDADLRDIFLAEGTDLFERIESLVLSLSSRRESPADALHELGRCFHTLKGAAGSVDLTELSILLHGMETFLEETGERVDEELLDQLHKLLHYLEGLFLALRRGGGAAPAQPPAPAPTPPPVATAPPAPTPPRPVAAARVTPTPIPGPARAVIPTAPAADAAPAPVAEPPAGEGPVRVSAERIDELMDLASELITRRGLWAAQAQTMKEFAALAKSCRGRMTATVDRLRDLRLDAERPARGGKPEAFDHRADLPELIRRLVEQADDLGVLAETALAAAKPLSDNSDALARLTLQLWEALQAIRIVSIKGLFQRLMRVAHDAARVEGRQVEVVTVGDDVGLDRAVQDKAFEPLLHVVRNAVGHGIEPPDERTAAGKPAAGRITLEAARSGSTLVVSVQDDGRGLDYEAIAAKGRRLGLIGPDDRPGIDRLNALIFQSGFSTRDQANAIAGRGVGMDVVSQEVGKLHGTIALTSERGAGTRMSVALPARLSLEQAMVLRVDGRAVALPVELVDLACAFEPESVETDGPVPTLRLRDEPLPLISAREVLGLPFAALPAAKVLVVRVGGESLALLVDAIDGTRELVVKPLCPLLTGHPVVAGTSLTVTGEVVLALNPTGLARWAREGVAGHASGPVAAGGREPLVALVVDDSISVRKVLDRHLRGLGFEVEEASDGLDALGKLRGRTYALIITDLEMPRMDGFELLAELSRQPLARGAPVMVASTRDDPDTRRRVLGLGACDFLSKPIEPEELEAKVRARVRAEAGAAARGRGPTPPAATAASPTGSPTCTAL